MQYIAGNGCHGAAKHEEGPALSSTLSKLPGSYRTDTNSIVKQGIAQYEYTHR